jgi:carboxypeptidase C (cathepsin A)
MLWKLLPLTSAALALQIPLNSRPTTNAFDFSSAEDARLLSVESPEASSFDYHITHAAFKGHQLRIRQPKLCDSVKQWSGYLDTPSGRHFYFHTFESRHDPVNDPVQLWLNGGVRFYEMLLPAVDRHA